MDAAQHQKITGYFILEAQEHIEVMTESLRDFQKTIDDAEQIHEIYRGAHSIKGGAAMLDFESIRFTAHRLEDFFKFLKNNTLTITESLTHKINQVFDALQQQIAKLAAQKQWDAAAGSAIVSELTPLCSEIMTGLERLAAGEVLPEESAAPVSSTADVASLAQTAPPSASASADADELEALLSGFDTHPSIEADELSNLLSAFDTYPSLPEPSPPSTPAEALDYDLSALFGDMPAEDLGAIAPSEALPESNGAGDEVEQDLLTIAQASEHTRFVPPAAADSLADLFGDDFSFNNLESSLPSIEVPEQPPKPNAPSSASVSDDLEGELDDLFGAVYDSETQEILDTPIPVVNHNAAIAGLDAAVPQGSLHDDSEDFDDLLAIGSADTTIVRDRAQDWANLEALADVEPVVPAAAIPAPRLESTGDDKDTLLGEEGDELTVDEISDIEAFLSGEAIAVANDEAVVVDLAAELDDLLGMTSDQEADALAAEMDALLEEAAPSPPFPEMPVPSEAELNELLGIPVVSTPVPAPPIPAPAPETPVYYEAWDVLEPLLDQDAIPSLNELAVATTFAELEVLLDALPQLPVTADSSSPSVAEPEVSPVLEEDFSDLEDMVMEVRQQAGELTAETPGRPKLTKPRPNRPKVEATLKIPVKQMDNLNNLVGELVVNRNTLEGDEERLRQFLESLMHQVQNLNDVGGRMQDLYERSLLEDALLRSRREYRAKQSSDLMGMGNVGQLPLSGSSGEVETTSDFDELEMDSFTKFHELAQETIEMIVRVRESTSDIQFLVDDIDQVARTLRQVTSQIQEGLNKSRMVPFGNTASRLPLAVKRIAPQLKKQANLELEGQETLVDKMILEHLSDPLTHLVNNALTHGIEVPGIRIASGKPQAGLIRVSALQQGNQTVISVSDDGAGIDPDRVKQKAVEKGLITAAEAARMDKLEVYDLLFHPGFSTKDQADNFAGRGVGLDVVRTSINEIRGVVAIDSKLGRGTTFTIRLPLTLTVSKALCCLSEGAPIAFSIDGVEDMVDVPQSKVRRNERGQLCLPWRDQVLTYHPLSSLLTYNRRIGHNTFYGAKRDENVLPVVILRGADSHIAVGVDQVIGEQEIVIKQLQGPVPKPPGIAGATVRGDGTIMAIADVLELIELSQGRLRREGPASWQDATKRMESPDSIVRTESVVLIVDDSITVRELLSMTFSKAGYRVEPARDGQDAWDKLRSGLPCDIIFCDIEMPRLDGLELLARLSEDEDLARIPIAMLTSRGADRHRRVAAELGASGYFTKPYLEDVLLDAAERMMQGEVLLENSTRKPQTTKMTPKSAPQMIAPQIQSASALPSNAQVLIIDDSVTVRSLLSLTFEKAGYLVEQARDGKEAWEKLQNGLMPDLIFCDIEMPRLDGLELLGQLFEDEELRRIPVAMLTSRGAERHRRIAGERGASGYFTKPYVEQELLAAAERMVRGEVLLKHSVREPGLTTKGEPAAAEMSAMLSEVNGDTNGTVFTPAATVFEPPPQATPTPAMNRKPKVLIIDDSITVRSLLSMTFEKAGYEVEQARDGREALEKLQGGLDPDVAFCDIEMPKMDGLTLLTHLQEDPELQALPVAMLTSRGAKKHKLAAAERGARGYFTKPYVEDILLDAAARLRQGEVLLTVEA